MAVEQRLPAARAGSRASYRGRVVALSGNRVVARLTSSGARSVLLRLLLQIDASGAVTGIGQRPGDERMTAAHGSRDCCAASRTAGADARPAPARPRPAAGAAARRRGAQLLDVVERSGLRGRGGAHVSTALKLRAVASRRRRAIVVGQRRRERARQRARTRPCSPAPRTWSSTAPWSAAAAVGADEAIVVRQAPRPARLDARSPAPSPSAAARAAGRSLRLVAAPPTATSAARRRR